MKRTNFLTNAIVILLFAAMLAYIAIYAVSRFSSSYHTALAVQVEIVDSVTVSGIIVREETVVSSGENYTSLAVSNGELIGRGETLALAYSGETALERANRIRELELQQQYIEAALAGSSDRALAEREGSIKSSVTDLMAAVARRELGDVAEASVTLASLVMDNPNIYVSEVDLGLVTSELESLKSEATYDTRAITAPVTGLFFSSVDGYEHLGPKDVSGLSLEGLRELMTPLVSAPPEEGLPNSEEAAQRSTVLGKIVDSLEWYYAAEVPFETARELVVGGRATLDFGRYCSEPLSARVIEIRHDADKPCVVLFRCTQSAAELLYARNVQADIQFDSVTGIRVPTEAIYEEEVYEKDSSTSLEVLVKKKYIYTVTGLQAEKKYISIIWESEDFCLAEISPSEPNSLREGNEIIITDREIHDGMLLE